MREEFWIGFLMQVVNLVVLGAIFINWSIETILSVTLVTGYVVFNIISIYLMLLGLLVKK